MRTLSRTLATGALVTALSAAVVVPASAAAAPGRQLKNAATGLCLAVGKSEVKKGKRVIQWSCNGLKDQQWIYSHHKLVNAKTGMCLAIAHGDRRKGKYVIQWPCTDGGIEQEWAYDDYQRFQNRATGLCLAIGKSEARKGKWAIQWTCKTIADQAWYMQ
ncbi:RICIN domain-containing protein [Nonomuraea sp. NPDC049141]|uniref:RICIN domain-containing protein n=1 Tax=unclassified Nonomuraea TaxID=2593643 RepID=UPI0033E6FDE1